MRIRQADNIRVNADGKIFQSHMAASRKSRPLERKDFVRTSAWVEVWVHGSIARHEVAECVLRAPLQTPLQTPHYFGQPVACTAGINDGGVH